MKCPGCGSSLFDGQKCEACGRPATDTAPVTDSKPTTNREQALFWGIVVSFVIVVLLHRFADRIWDEEPALLKWFGVGLGCLVILGNLFYLVAGSKADRIMAFGRLTISALIVVIGLIWSSADPTDTAIAELTEKIDRAAEKLQMAEAQPLQARITTINENVVEINKINHQLASITSPEQLDKLSGTQMGKITALMKRTNDLIAKQRELVKQGIEDGNRLKKDH
jgi:hypothetical protein